jgi:uncharacterized protein YodC (DUF2158 family)
MSFNPGDAVQLKTGGPAMTVRETASKEGIEQVICDWFDKGGLARGQISGNEPCGHTFRRSRPFLLWPRTFAVDKGGPL